jgi:hypothetical protein
MAFLNPGISDDIPNQETGDCDNTEILATVSYKIEIGAIVCDTDIVTWRLFLTTLR